MLMLLLMLLLLMWRLLTLVTSQTAVAWRELPGSSSRSVPPTNPTRHAVRRLSLINASCHSVGTTSGIVVQPPGQEQGK